jgi:DNA-binding MarR family transcriptional regulator
LWNIAGFNLRMLDLRMMKSFSERLAETGLTPAAASVVLVVESNPGLPLGKLADALMVKRPNMTKLVKRLEARALVRRSTAAGDKRSISLVLTAAGQRHAKNLRALQTKHDAFALAGLKSAERVQLMKFVARILATLDSADRKPG